jgi:hypothetical protein
MYISYQYSWVVFLKVKMWRPESAAIILVKITTGLLTHRHRNVSKEEPVPYLNFVSFRIQIAVNSMWSIQLHNLVPWYF